MGLNVFSVLFISRLVQPLYLQDIQTNFILIYKSYIYIYKKKDFWF